MLSRVPTYIITMLVVTGIYLTIEIPFSVHLVQVLGGVATQDDIDRIETFGRILTGVAVGLAYIGMRTFPILHKDLLTFRESLWPAIKVFVPIVADVYYGLHFYGEFRGSFSDGEMRKNSFISNLAKRSIAENGLAGLPPSNDPSWLASISGLPIFMSADKLVELSGKSLDDLTRLEAKRGIGDAEKARDRFFSELDEKISGSYDEFAAAQRRFHGTLQDSDQIVAEKWDQYVSSLKANFSRDLPRPGSQMHREVIKRLHEDGMPVPWNFNLSDRFGFFEIGKKQVAIKAFNDFSEGVRENFGRRSQLNPRSTKSDFYRDPKVQSEIRDRIDDMTIPAGLIISPDMKMNDFAVIYEQMVGRAAKTMKETAIMDASDFSTVGNSDLGQNAVKAATLPATALLLSLGGALFHIFKFSGYVVAIIGSALGSRFLSSSLVRHGLAASALAAAIIWMNPHVPDVISNRMIGHVYDPQGTAVTAAISLQPGMFVIGDAVSHIGPWKFIGGYLPEARITTETASFDTVSSEMVGSIVPTPSVKPADVADAIGFVPPVPIPRPE